MMRVKPIILFLAIAAGLIGSAVVYQQRPAGRPTSPAIAAATPIQMSAAASPDGGIPIISDLFKIDPISDTDAPLGDRLLEIISRLLLAVGLAALLAFRPRENVPLFRRSLFVSQTQILLALVAAALMMVVGDNAARAFAIFAAAALVRFRTNIRDPKEITVLLVSLALGLAAGVGRWDLGLALCGFALGLLWLLEHKESQNVYRSMEVLIKTRDTDKTQEVLKKIFAKKKLDAEVREIKPPEDEKSLGTIAFYLNLPLNMPTDTMSDKILEEDPQNIEKIQWSRTKSASDVYR